MKIKEKLKLEDLYFGYMNYDMSYSSEKQRSLSKHNLFDSSRVRNSVARWVLMSDEEKKGRDPLMWCFGDVWGRSEYEFMVSPWGGGGEPKKVDIWSMYVEPNRELLLDLISRVTKSSAQKHMREWRKAYKR